MRPDGIKSEPKEPQDESTSSSVDLKDSIDIKPARTPQPVQSTSSSSSSSSEKKEKCIFKPEDLQRSFMPVLQKLYQQEESAPFREPVDPLQLGIPDYLDIIKQPMDLSTIRGKLDVGQYVDPWNFVDDVWLMFDNVLLYNKKTSRVYKCCTKLPETFEQEIDPVMQNLGYCCGRKYTFSPQTLCCFGKQLQCRYDTERREIFQLPKH
ncbi:histone lysine acetyltransferase CREBBP-like [Planococcus citri]|uniref:histone lysine acetyltransferase CREBBP-like n=1 Tax=Planococcus citri TaxID=170843 RepID=UPI0031F93DA3